MDHLFVNRLAVSELEEGHDEQSSCFWPEAQHGLGGRQAFYQRGHRHHGKMKKHVHEICPLFSRTLGTSIRGDSEKISSESVNIR